MDKQPQFFDICIFCSLPEEAEAIRSEFEARCQPFQSAVTEKRKYPYWLKSVCDNGDPAKNDHYHDYAAHASAVYLLHFIQEHVTEEKMPRPHASNPAKPDRTGNPPKPTNIRVISTPSWKGNKAMILLVLDETEHTLEYVRHDHLFSNQIIFLKHKQQELVRLAVPFARLKSVEKHADFQIDGVGGLLTFKMTAGIMNIKVEVGGVEAFHN